MAKKMRWHNASMRVSRCKESHVYEIEDQLNVQVVKTVASLFNPPKVEVYSGVKDINPHSAVQTRSSSQALVYKKGKQQRRFLLTL